VVDAEEFILKRFGAAVQFSVAHRFAIYTWFSNFHTYIYDYIIKLCRQQAEILNHDIANFRNIGQDEPRHRKYKRIKLGGGQSYDRSSDLTAVVAGATNNRA
jgi:hypothetical protein